MKNELLESFLGKTLEYLNSAEAFLQKNVPAYVEELLAYEFYSSLFELLFFILILIASIIFFKKAKEVEKDMCSGDKVLTAISAFVLIVFSVVSVVAIPLTISHMIKVKIAPRVYLVETISKQLGQK